jgi:hypothetical protein
MLLTEIDTVDRLLSAHAAELGNDLPAYRNHTYRVVNLCVALSSLDPETLEKFALAAVFHDLGIWTDGTWDYLEPSVAQATAHLAATKWAGWIPEISAMIREHHKITPYRGTADPNVETFRKADWIDVTRGVLRFGLSRSFLRSLYSTWPDAGFHAFLIRQTWTRVKRHPLSPLPMFRW